MTSLFEQEDRFVLFPIKDEELWDFYQKGLKMNWGAAKFDPSKDLNSMEKAPEQIKHALKLMLAFFAVSDGWIGENLAVRFYGETKIPEARQFFGWQIFNEGVHVETYQKFLKDFIHPREREKFFKPLNDFASVALKARFTEEFFNEEKYTFPERLVAFAAIEGIFFQASFATIFYIRDLAGEKAMFQNFAAANQEILRDEWTHAQFQAALSRKEAIERKQPVKIEFIEDVLKRAVAIEKQFASDALAAGELPGLTKQMLHQHIEAVADTLAAEFRIKPVFGTQTPFGFMDKLNMKRKTNFHEREVTEYNNANFISGELSAPDLDTDF
jgi:ribonucleoside-diphosphate reductase beta chain